MKFYWDTKEKKKSTEHTLANNPLLNHCGEHWDFEKFKKVTFLVVFESSQWSFEGVAKHKKKRRKSKRISIKKGEKINANEKLNEKQKKLEILKINKP